MTMSAGNDLNKIKSALYAGVAGEGLSIVCGLFIIAIIAMLTLRQRERFRRLGEPAGDDYSLEPPRLIN